MLRPELKRTLEFIDAATREAGGVCPTYATIAAALGYKSRSRVHEHVCELEARGYLTRIPHCKQALRVIRMPGPAAKTSGLHKVRTTVEEMCWPIPMMGKIS